MPTQRRRFSRVLRPAALAAAALFLSFLSAPGARAQNIVVTIADAFVASVNNTAYSPCTASGSPVQFVCPIETGPSLGNISNDPQIQFSEDGLQRCNLTAGDPTKLTNPNTQSTLDSNGGYTDNAMNVCNNEVYMCATVEISGADGSVPITIDQVEFEIFRYVDGSNPLLSDSTPPLRTFYIDNAGSCTSVSAQFLPGCTATASNAYCVLWDGSQPIQGGFGKINGTYGFRVTVATNEQGQSGPIAITQTRAFPSGATKDMQGQFVSQKAITVNVNDVHVVQSTPTIVGAITGVYAQPYNFSYRLSQAADMWITINSTVNTTSPPYKTIRNVLNGVPRTGEGNLGTTGATAQPDGDSWDGRDNNGNLLPAGTYLAVFQSNGQDQYTINGLGDLSDPTTTQLALDPLSITDIRVTPLLGGATSLALISYQLTEQATVYLDIYPPGTQFCNGLNNVTSNSLDQPDAPFTGVKNFGATLSGNCAAPGTYLSPLRSVSQQQTAHSSVFSFWDGRDLSGNLMGDGDYVYVLYASLPSQAGTGYGQPASLTDLRIWTTVAKTGYMSVLRGLVGVNQISPTTTVIGSSPAVSGLYPFFFNYSLTRPATVSVLIFSTSNASVPIKTLINQQTRPAGVSVETWLDGVGDNGYVVPAGIYMVQLTAADPAFPAKVSTTTAQFPVDLYRIIDVAVTPLSSGATSQATVSYQLSAPMFVALNIYPPGSAVINSTVSWPPCAGAAVPGACTSPSVVSSSGVPVAPIFTIAAMRSGRVKLTEFWQGTDSNSNLVPDGNYVYTLVAQSSSPSSATTPPYFADDHVFGNVAVARGMILFTTFDVKPAVLQMAHSSDTITLDPYTVTWTVTRQSSVTLQILNSAVPPQVVRTIIAGQVRQSGILNTDVWDGRDDNNNFPPSGFYTVRAIALDVGAIQVSPSTATFSITYDPLRLYDLAAAPISAAGANAVINYQVSETMKVSVKIYKPGTTFDTAGSPSPPETDASGRYLSLVNRIVGIRPARTEITDVWNGRDFTQTLVPDGNYKFRIVGSTDPTAIDSITGNVLNPSSLAEDRLIDDLPVAVSGSANPKADFENNTIVYPNPVTGPSATFAVYLPFHGQALLKLYTISGQLILNQDLGDQPASYLGGPVVYVWNKVNQSGRAIARGLYYAVIRVEETEGGANVFQTVRKVLVP